MFKIKQKRIPRKILAKSTPHRLLVKRTEDAYVINFDPSHPPQVFFDTNVLRGLNDESKLALQRLQITRGFRYRYSMLNFTELASHLADPPSPDTRVPFRKFQASFRRLKLLFDFEPLPSPEMVLMHGTGLERHLSPAWVVNPSSIAKQVQMIAQANTIDDLLEFGIDPHHYKQLREIDGKMFLKLMSSAKTTIKNPPSDLEEGGHWLQLVYSYLIYRASSKTLNFSGLTDNEKLRVKEFFDEEGGKMFLSHLLKLLLKAINDGAKEDPNDFYDMLQLILLRDPNLLFVTDDRPFFRYYVSPEDQRVVPWKGFKACN
jgi:hypothetical protein